ncbi:unnamed protein product [Pleuronectes platessa]|uniref:Uncharacterized protein n=1 Tax=Pleuronectes platessa TaxID=8262 RepID=A0A9N7Z690_PLEPL|nr:unnamed protein product [Pleuronectes platessa]
MCDPVAVGQGLDARLNMEAHVCEGVEEEEMRIFNAAAALFESLGLNKDRGLADWAAREAVYAEMHQVCHGRGVAACKAVCLGIELEKEGAPGRCHEHHTNCTPACTSQPLTHLEGWATLQWINVALKINAEQRATTQPEAVKRETAGDEPTGHQLDACNVEGLKRTLCLLCDEGP